MTKHVLGSQYKKVELCRFSKEVRSTSKLPCMPISELTKFNHKQFTEIINI